jgi:hypothetical protein
MKNGINIYSKIEKDISVFEQQKDLSQIEKYRNALEQMPQSSNFFEREKDT